MKLDTSTSVRHTYIRLVEGDLIPDAFAHAARETATVTGWIRAHGVLRNVELRALGPTGLGETRDIEGPVHAIVLEGSIGFSRGQPTVGLRCVLSEETPTGILTTSGEIVSARVVALEAVLETADGIALERALDVRAGMILLGSTEGHPPPVREPQDTGRSAWAQAAAGQPAARASTQQSPAPAAVIPARPPAKKEVEEMTVFPEAGDMVDHFAFGSSEVIKSDGDRLHLKVGRDGRIAEIVLEKLKVTLLGEDNGHRRFRLDRKL